MPTWKPDPSFYPSPRLAMEAPPESVAYVSLLNAAGEGPGDGIGVVDTDPASPTYGQLVHVTEGGLVVIPKGMKVT